MANRIGVKRNANGNTMLRRMFISPEAWRRQEIAHSYYYKCDRVIGDVASYMADWSRHAPSRFLPVGGLVADTLRWAVVALFVLSIFAVSVPLANRFAGKTEAKPAPTQTKPEPKLIEEETQVCAVHTVMIELPLQAPGDVAWAAARRAWNADVGPKLGADWANADQAEQAGQMEYERRFRGTGSSGDIYEVEMRMCKPRPIDCQDTPHGSEVAFELSSELDPSLAKAMTSTVVSTLKERWQSEAVAKYGSDWSDVAFNFETLRKRHPVEDGCKGEDAGGGRTRYQCKVTTTACKKPAPRAGEPQPVRGAGAGGRR
jgi:hypothetical protein